LNRDNCNNIKFSKDFKNKNKNPLVVPKRCEEGLHEEIREIAFVILRRKP
jgi:hypothetical protein